MSEHARAHVAPPVPLRALPSLIEDVDWAAQVTSVAIIRLDARGNVRTWNPGAERIKGYRAGEIVGSSFERFYRPQERERGVPAKLLAAAARDGSVENTGWRVRADGSLFWAHVVITAIRTEDAGLTGYVKFTRDLTSHKRQEDQREAFLRAFAHDFLSPVTALRGYVDLLEESLPDQQDLLAHVSTVSDHLLAMMDELRGYIHGGAGSRAEDVSLAALTREAAELVLPGEGRDRVRVTGDAVVVTDASVLRRAIANVIDNAAKYSDDTIAVTVARAGEEAVVRVSDRGRGIAAEDLPSILDIHQRGSLADPHDGGTGVGLASVREILERLGGRVEVASTVGEGTTLQLVLPANRPA
jgi:PAS domain S-box-containing protein